MTLFIAILQTWTALATSVGAFAFVYYGRALLVELRRLSSASSTHSEIVADNTNATRIAKQAAAQAAYESREMTSVFKDAAGEYARRHGHGRLTAEDSRKMQAVADDEATEKLAGADRVAWDFDVSEPPTPPDKGPVAREPSSPDLGRHSASSIIPSR